MAKNHETENQIQPQVSDFERPTDFLRALYVFYKNQGGFSIRQRTEKLGTLSQAMISQILSGRRNLTTENLNSVAAVFKLTSAEKTALQSLLQPQKTDSRKSPPAILSDWLNPYVKELAHLHGFSPDAHRLFLMLSGLATPARIRHSISFLFKEGLWSSEDPGKIPKENFSVLSSMEFPLNEVRNFHKRALDIAKDGLMKMPATKRKSSTILMSIDKDKAEELNKLFESFEKQLMSFAKRNPQGKDQLLQFVMHLTPVGHRINSSASVTSDH